MGGSSVAGRVFLGAAVIVTAASASVVALAAPVKSDSTLRHAATASAVRSPSRVVYTTRPTTAATPHRRTVAVAPRRSTPTTRPSTPRPAAVRPHPAIATTTTTTTPPVRRAPAPAVLPAPAPPAAPAPAPRPAPTVGVADPSVSVQPSAAFSADCNGMGSAAVCNSAALASINSARAGEGLGPLVLPANFNSLDAVGQLIAVTNAERTSRGLPAMTANASLNAMAGAGAQAGNDPSGPAGYSWGSNITWGYTTALAADFAWMYDDGPGGTNIGCKAAGQSGCWDHRHNILAPWGGSIGAGAYTAGGSLHLTILLVENY